MVLAVEGEADFILEGKVFRMKAGDMLLMPPNAPHALKTLTPFKMLLVMLRSGGES
jgi:Cupin domain.